MSPAATGGDPTRRSRRRSRFANCRSPAHGCTSRGTGSDGRGSSAPPAPSTCATRRSRSRPPPTAPQVVTVHDVAFVHAPERFTRHGVRVMSAGLERCRAADLDPVPERATIADLVDLGFDADRIRHVPWGVDRPRGDRRRSRAGARSTRPPGSVRAVRRDGRAAQEPALAWPMRSSGSTPVAARRRRSARMGRRRRATRPTCGSSASCRRPTCRRCTRVPTIFAYPEPARGLRAPDRRGDGVRVASRHEPWIGDRGDRRRRRGARRSDRRRLDRGRTRRVPPMTFGTGRSSDCRAAAAIVPGRPRSMRRVAAYREAIG